MRFTLLPLWCVVSTYTVAATDLRGYTRVPGRCTSTDYIHEATDYDTASDCIGLCAVYTSWEGGCISVQYNAAEKRCLASAHCTDSSSDYDRNAEGFELYQKHASKSDAPTDTPTAAPTGVPTATPTSLCACPDTGRKDDGTWAYDDGDCASWVRENGDDLWCDNCF